MLCSGIGRVYTSLCIVSGLTVGLCDCVCVCVCVCVCTVQVDVRGSIMRLAPVPLYNSFHDLWRFFSLLKTALGHP